MAAEADISRERWRLPMGDSDDTKPTREADLGQRRSRPPRPSRRRCLSLTLVTVAGGVVMLLAVANYLYFALCMKEAAKGPGVNLGLAFIWFASLVNLPIAIGWVIYFVRHRTQ